MAIILERASFNNICLAGFRKSDRYAVSAVAPKKAEKENNGFPITVTLNLQQVDRTVLPATRIGITSSGLLVNAETGDSLKDVINKAVAQELIASATFDEDYLTSITYDSTAYTLNGHSCTYTDSGTWGMWNGQGWMYFVGPARIPSSDTDYPTQSMAEYTFNANAQITLSFEKRIMVYRITETLANGIITCTYELQLTH